MLCLCGVLKIELVFAKEDFCLRSCNNCRYLVLLSSCRTYVRCDFLQLFVFQTYFMKEIEHYTNRKAAATDFIGE